MIDKTELVKQEAAASAIAACIAVNSHPYWKT